MKISVVTAVLNRAGTIRDAIQSVRSQSYAQLEHVIKDGGSTDGTLEIIHSLSSDKFRVIQGPDRGLYDAINIGIQQSTGDVVGLLHSDDFFADNRVIEKVATLMRASDADGLYGDLDYVSSTSPFKVIRHWRAGKYRFEDLAHGWMPPHPTIFLRREIFETLGMYDTRFEIAADYEAILRWLIKGRISFAYLPEVMVKMRLGGVSNRSIGRILKKSLEDYRVIRANGIGGIGVLVKKNFRKIGQFFN